MSTPVFAKCPHCKKDFQARRKNQRYCSTECRTDANNEVAKGRYAHFKKEAPENEALKEKLKRLQTYLAQQIIVLKNVKKLDKETILYEGLKYIYNANADPPPLPISLKHGGGLLMPGSSIIYINEESESLLSNNFVVMPKYSEYVLIKK